MILVDRTIPLLCELLSQHEAVLEFDYHDINAAFLRNVGCTALFFRSTLKVTPALLDSTLVQFLGSVTSGSDHIAPEVASNPRYTLALATGANANAVAEYVLASILLWCQQQDSSPRDSTVGIVGFGNIGRRVAWYCQKLGMSVIVNDPPLADSGFSFPAWTTVASLDEVLQSSTIVTNHVPLVTSGRFPTLRLFDASRLHRCAARLIVHTSRGGVVVERALMHSTRRGVAVAVDVWEREPNVSPFLVQRALLATPHIAGHSANAKLTASVMVSHQYANWKGIQLQFPSMTFPTRTLLDSDANHSDVLARLLAARCWDQDTETLRRLIRLPRQQRCNAIEHFRATYPQRYEVFRTPYDSEWHDSTSN